jgi:integrase
MEKLSDILVRKLTAPERGNKITYERGPDAVRGFGIRITASGAKSFVINYTVAGRERRYTIGSYPAWSVVAARDEAKRLRQDVDRGIDPLGQRNEERESPTVSELCDRYLTEHASRKRTGANDKTLIEKYVRPEFGNGKVTSIAFGDIDRLHQRITRAGKPYQANRVHSLLTKMFSLAIRWQMRDDNPAKGVARNLEQPRHRYLAGGELQRLTEALAVHPNQTAANAVRLLLLTGARRGEVLSATWSQFDLESGVWVKPSSSTKQQRIHRVPLSAPVQQLLVEIRQTAKDEASPYLFPGRNGAPPDQIDSDWAALCKAAGLQSVRLHDLRHTYASVLVSAGLSLPVIGALLGHSRPDTTARYAHLFDDPLRAATERAGAIITGTVESSSAEIVPITDQARRTVR